MHRTVVLGDSRVFDTYYATEAYAGRTYGYHQTFPHLLQRRFAHVSIDGIGYDCVHIPDHFRGRTIENNILRLALTDPDCVVLCDGIWESLVSKKHVAEWAETQRAQGLMPPEYSDGLATELFLAGKLSLSPKSYAERVSRIASWFIRRRRHVIWMTTPVPPIGYRDGLHDAGNYRPFDGWHACLDALNAETRKAMVMIGGSTLDVDGLMARSGGASEALIDQWHFSAAFHARIAKELGDLILLRAPIAADCVSRELMTPGHRAGFRAVLLGSVDDRLAFRRRFPGVEIVRETQFTEILDDPPPIVIAAYSEPWERDAAASALTRRPRAPVVLFPEELSAMDNPAVADRSAFGVFR